MIMILKNHEGFRFNSRSILSVPIGDGGVKGLIEIGAYIKLKVRGR